MMDNLQFTAIETRLATERRLKFQGTAQVDLRQIGFDSRSTRQLDRKNVDRLCRIFEEVGCQNLAIENRIPAVISSEALATALRNANITAQELRADSTSTIPQLQFADGQLRGLHGRHRIAAGSEILLPGYRCWAVDLYLDDICEDLKTTLIDEYSDEKPPTDGEIYRKIRQYASDGNLHGELRWKARLNENNRERFESLTKNTRLRQAFDGVLGIPGHRSSMRISMLGRVLAIRCDEEIAHYLNYVKDVWYSIVGHDPQAVAKIDQQTVEELQMRVPRVEKTEVRGLILGGKVFAAFSDQERSIIWERLQLFDGLIPSLYSFFEDFKCFESWASCLRRLFIPEGHTMRVTMSRPESFSCRVDGACVVQTSEASFSSRSVPQSKHFELAYRQMWLYALRHYPQMPSDPKRNNRLAKAQIATADKRAIFNMACLARRLGFRSPQITALVAESPDQMIAREALFRAREPDRFRYDSSVIDSLVDQMVNLFNAAVPREPEPPSSVVAIPVMQKRRCGYPKTRDFQRDQAQFFLDHIHKVSDTPEKITSFFVRRCIYLAFFGPSPSLPGENHLPLSQESTLFVMGHASTDVSPSTSESAPESQMETEPTITFQPAPVQITTVQTTTQHEERTRPAERTHVQAAVDDLPRQAAESENWAFAHAQTVDAVRAEQDRNLERLQREINDRAAQQERQQKVLQEMIRRVQEAEDLAAAQAVELEQLRQPETVAAVPDENRSLSGEEYRDESDRQVVDATDLDAEDSLDEIIHNDAELRAAGDHDAQDQALWEAQHRRSAAEIQSEDEVDVDRERDIALELLQGGPSQSEPLMIPSDSPQRYTQLNPQEWGAEDSSHTPSHVEDVPRIPRLGGKKGTLKKAGVKKSPMKGRPTIQQAQHEASRVAAVADELGLDLDAPPSTSTPTIVIEPPTEASRPPHPERRIIEGQLEDSAPNPHAMTPGGRQRADVVTGFNFTDQIAQQQTAQQQIEEPRIVQPPNPTNMTPIGIKFYHYDGNDWERKDVLPVKPSNTLPLQKIVQGYKQKNFLVLNVKKQAIAKANSFHGATIEGVNALFVIPKSMKDQIETMDLLQVCRRGGRLQTNS